MFDTDDRNAEDSFAEWDLCMPLVADSAINPGFRIRNHPNGETHRVHLTGYDRHNTMVVRGRLFHVIHGRLSPDDSTPATLIVFEWLLIPGKLGRRFRQVQVDVTFAPHGRRPGTLPSDDLSEYTPQVRVVAPDVPAVSYITRRGVTSERYNTAGLRAGYDPFAAATADVSRGRVETTERTDYRFVAGYPAFVRKTWGDPNSVHWTMQENAPQESGVPHLCRRPEKFRKAVGRIPEDDPVYFDPRPVPGVPHGAAVLYGPRDNVRNQQSPCDKDNLGAMDLTRSLVVEDEQPRVG
ncbi:hypothetical protein GGS23DRAFT_613944 [Durotheca rogersii]|uniref:uncharacterized protein n=1 Tax=Durotheca rogersii TaxID=419775 RepID=UPI00221FF74C|nr:uncharacterized protein GGS23DRAFT_613944 [Durotheca rogersii]KAI5860378.1 hypothetical protein GGS23DRAFT_613944 [Durotheca rogersii]